MNLIYSAIDLVTCHASFQVVKKDLNQCSIPIFDLHIDISFLCTSFHVSKVHKLPYTSSNTRVDSYFNVVHSNIWVSPLLSNNGYSYYIHFTNAFSRYIWIYFLKHKYGIIKAFLQFKSQAEFQIGCKIKVL